MVKNNYNGLLEKIIQLEKGIRFVSICDQFGTVVEKLQRNGDSLLLNNDDTEQLVREGVNSWHIRKQLSHKIGKGQYAMAAYEKIIRLTIPIDDDTLLLVSFDNTGKTPEIVKTIKNFLQE